MTVTNIINSRNIKLIIIAFMLGALFILNLFVLNKVISNSNEESRIENTLKRLH